VKLHLILHLRPWHVDQRGEVARGVAEDKIMPLCLGRADATLVDGREMRPA
jgi:hypothetical protein